MSFAKLACVAAAVRISWAAAVSEGSGECAAHPTQQSAGEHVMLQSAQPVTVARHFPAEQAPNAAANIKTPALSAAVLDTSSSRQQLVASKRAESNQAPLPNRWEHFTLDYVGKGQCIYEDSNYCKVQQAQDTRCFTKLGWATCYGGTMKACQGLQACKDDCAEDETCAAMAYADGGHCFKYLATKDSLNNSVPYIASNGYLPAFDCYIKKTDHTSLPPATHTTTTTTSGFGGSFYVGEPGASCDVACANHGGCFQPMLLVMDTVEEVGAMALRAGLPCDAYKDSYTPKTWYPAFKHKQMTHENGTAYQGIMCYWKPDFSDPGSRLCDASSNNVIRFCPCNDQIA